MDAHHFAIGNHATIVIDTDHMCTVRSEVRALLHFFSLALQGHGYASEIAQIRSIPYATYTS